MVSENASWSGTEYFYQRINDLLFAISEAYLQENGKLMLRLLQDLFSNVSCFIKNDTVSELWRKRCSICLQLLLKHANIPLDEIAKMLKLKPVSIGIVVRCTKTLVDMESEISRDSIRKDIEGIEELMFKRVKIPDQFGRITETYPNMNKYMKQLDRIREKILIAVQEQKLLLGTKPKDADNWQGETIG